MRGVLRAIGYEATDALPQPVTSVCEVSTAEAPLPA